MGTAAARKTLASSCPLYPESLSPSIRTTGTVVGTPCFEIPNGADTSYLAHGFFRYIGKYPPQLVSDILNRHYTDGAIVDPMCGGGTTLIEARLRGIDAIGCDVNPVARTISAAVSNAVDHKQFSDACRRIMLQVSEEAGTLGPLFVDEPRKRKIKNKFDIPFCSEYFSDNTLSEIGRYREIIEDESDVVRNLLFLSLFAVLRKVSRANIKKMNLEIDDSKKIIVPFSQAIVSQLQMLEAANREYEKWARPCNIRVIDADAQETGLENESAAIVFLHPPYLTNTAFCEFTQLQLAILKIDHKSIWKRELRCRGSFLHESNGLKKYLVGWHNIIKEAIRLLRPKGILVTVVGDGQIDYVRIPVGSITLEFAKDHDLELLEHSLHVLNNNTGRTQSRKMVGQHVAVFQKK